MDGDLNPLDPADWFARKPAPEWRVLEQGRYRYASCAVGQNDFAPNDVEERYTVFVRDTDGRHYVRAQRDARRTPAGVELRVESWGDEHRIDRVQLNLIGESDAVSATYAMSQNDVTVRFGPAPNVREGESIGLPPGCLCLPLTRNYLGPVIAAISRRQNGTAPVLVPDLRDVRSSTVLSPLIGTREVSLCPESTEIGRSTSGAVRAYHFVGGPYDRRSVFWVCGETHRLVRYLFTAESGERWSAEWVDMDTQPV